MSQRKRKPTFTVAFIGSSVLFILLSINYYKNVIYIILFVIYCCFYVIYTLHLCRNLKSKRMKTKFLFPNKFNRIGLILLCLSILITLFFGINGENKLLTKVPVFYVYDSGPFLQDITNKSPIMGFKYDDIRFELSITLFVLGCLLVGFSKLKSEDEFTIKLRLESLLWAMYINYAIFLFAVIFIYGMFFIQIPLLSTLAFLVIFIARFYYVLYQSKKSASYEK